MRLPLKNSIPATALAVALGIFASAATSESHDDDGPCLFGLIGHRGSENAAFIAWPVPVVTSALPAKA